MAAKRHINPIEAGSAYGAQYRVILMTDSDSNRSGEQLQPRPQFFVRYRAGLLRRLRTHFLTGIIATAPIGLTLYLAWVLVTFWSLRSFAWTFRHCRLRWSKIANK